MYIFSLFVTLVHIIEVAKHIYSVRHSDFFLFYFLNGIVKRKYQTNLSALDGYRNNVMDKQINNKANAE